MTTNLTEFNAALDRFSEKVVPETAVKVQQAVSLDALRRVVLKTPVDTGRARGNWQTTRSAPASGQLNREDKSGRESIAAGERSIAAIRPYGVVFITNNVDHIEVLEEGGFEPPDPGPSKDKRKGRAGRVLVKGGYSVQAPRGMVKITVEELLVAFRDLENPNVLAAPGIEP